MDRKYKFKTEPYAHQRAAWGASWNKEELAYVMEMGTCKSKVQIDNVASRSDYGHINYALIVASQGVYQNGAHEERQKH